MDKINQHRITRSKTLCLITCLHFILIMLFILILKYKNNLKSVCVSNLMYKYTINFLFLTQWWSRAGRTSRPSSPSNSEPHEAGPDKKSGPEGFIDISELLDSLSSEKPQRNSLFPSSDGLFSSRSQTSGYFLCQGGHYETTLRSPYSQIFEIILSVCERDEEASNFLGKRL